MKRQARTRTSPKPFRPILAIGAGAYSALREPHIVILLAMTISLIGCATVFYRWQEGWRWLDAAYFSVVTIASVGYGDLTPKTDAGKLFTILYIFSGIGLFVASAAAFANHIIHRANSGNKTS
jgi:voltage-gated potassium channel Kch